MRFYQEITLIETLDVSPYFIWSKLYTQLHLALVEQQNSDKTVNFGVSFPNYVGPRIEQDEKRRGSLGNKLRVFASSAEELQRLNLHKWLERLADYLHVRSIQPVPATTPEHVLVKRYRVDINLDRLTRRFIRRKEQREGIQITFKEARKLQNQRYAENQKAQQEGNTRSKAEDFPYIKMQSFSGEKEFSLQIQQIPVRESVQGTFSTYGLSNHATVPHW